MKLVELSFPMSLRSSCETLVPRVSSWSINCQQLDKCLKFHVYFGEIKMHCTPVQNNSRNSHGILDIYSVADTLDQVETRPVCP